MALDLRDDILQPLFLTENDSIVLLINLDCPESVTCDQLEEHGFVSDLGQIHLSVHVLESLQVADDGILLHELLNGWEVTSLIEVVGADLQYSFHCPCVLDMAGTVIYSCGLFVN